MINIIATIVYLILLVFSLIRCMKAEDKDLEICWGLSGLLWFILIVINVVVAALSKGKMW